MQEPSPQHYQDRQPAFLTADLYDEHHKNLQVCGTQFKSFGQHRCFFGPCSTVTTFEDHTPVLRALDSHGNGRVLVVDGQGSLHTGLMGDRLAAIGVQNGWRGVIINGVIRDSEGINALSLGVRAIGVTARRGWKAGASERDIPLSFGQATFTPGHWVYADVDSVILSKTELALAGESTTE